MRGLKSAAAGIELEMDPVPRLRRGFTAASFLKADKRPSSRSFGSMRKRRDRRSSGDARSSHSQQSSLSAGSIVTVCSRTGSPGRHWLLSSSEAPSLCLYTKNISSPTAPTMSVPDQQAARGILRGDGHGHR